MPAEYPGFPADCGPSADQGAVVALGADAVALRSSATRDRSAGHGPGPIPALARRPAGCKELRAGRDVGTRVNSARRGYGLGP